MNKDIKMKKNLFLIFFFLTLINPLLAWDNDETVKILQDAESRIVQIEDNEARAYIPYDLYNESVICTLNAHDSLEEGKIDEAYYYAMIATIKLETAEYRAKTTKSHIDTLTLIAEGKGGNASIPLPLGGGSSLPSSVKTLFDAGLIKKDATFHTDLFDKDILTQSGTDFSPKGIEMIRKISAVMKAYPSAQIQIIGHTSSIDRGGLSLSKARLCADKVEKNGINKKRIKSAGLGNRVVMETPLGYKRVDRIEIIITGIR